MFTLRPSADRGLTCQDGHESRHSFSFGAYVEPSHIRFRALRVLNEERIEPGRGISSHPHRDMELVTVVLGGELEHRDSLGNCTTLRAGEMQRITAGTGISHSIYNRATVPLHFFQIWIVPTKRRLTPAYERGRIVAEGAGFHPLVTPSATPNCLQVHQDATLFLSRLAFGTPLTHSVAAGRGVWVQVLRGRLKMNGHLLENGDGAGVLEESAINLEAIDDDAEALLFDLAQNRSRGERGET